MKHGLSFVFGLMIAIGCFQVAARGITGPATLAMSAALIGVGMLGVVGSLAAQQSARPLIWQAATVAGAVVVFPVLLVIAYVAAHSVGIVGAKRGPQASVLGDEGNHGLPMPPPGPPLSPPSNFDSPNFSTPQAVHSEPPAETAAAAGGFGAPAIPDRPLVPPAPVVQESPSPPAETPSARPPVNEPAAKQADNPNAIVGGAGGFEFKAVDAQRRPVIGFRYLLGSWAGQPALSRLDPLYDRRPDTTRGSALILAREGYAVGGVQVVAGDFVNAVRIVFVREIDGKLDKNDFYLSEWIGNPRDERPTTLGNGTARVIGVRGRRGGVIDALGLALDP